MQRYHIAQVNMGRIKGPLDGPVMAGFMARLDEINALADSGSRICVAFTDERGECDLLQAV